MRYISFIICFVYSVISISQTIVNPVFDRTDHPELHVDKMEVYKDSTLIHCTLSMEANTWANISPDTYIEDISTNQKYKIIRSDGIPFSPAVRNFVSSIECKVTFVFPPIPRATKINLIENPEMEAFNIYGINLTESFEKTYRETELSLITTKASFYETAGDTLRAIQYKLEEAEVAKYLYGTKSEEYIASLGWLSFLYWKTQDYDKAEPILSKVLDFVSELICCEQFYMSTEQKKQMWKDCRNLFYLYRDVVNKGDRDGAKLSKLYDYVLFSKGLSLDLEMREDGNLDRLRITWKDIQGKLVDKGIAIEFISTVSERTEEMQYGVYHALIIDRDCQYPQMITLVDERDFQNKKEGTLGDLIWGPIFTKYENVNNIYFSPDGVWNVLPIEYLTVDNIGYLFDKINMYRLSSTKKLVTPQKKLKVENAVLYGGLDYWSGEMPLLAIQDFPKFNLYRGIEKRGGFEPLYETLSEINEINEVLEKNNIKTVLYSGEDGTEDSFRNLSGKNIGIIHLATHGMYVNTDDWEQKKNENNFELIESQELDDISLSHSLLVMSGGNEYIHNEMNPYETTAGILTAKEVSQMDLTGMELVVLSACETARGDISVTDGVFGLQRGFKKAGANTILMSLDKVDDEATKVLMVEFYKNLMGGKTKLQSLKDAQNRLRQVDNGKYDDPKYWASFIMLDGLN